MSTRIAGLVDLFRSPSKPGTNNSIPTDFSVASFPAKRGNVSGSSLVGGIRRGRAGQWLPMLSAFIDESIKWWAQ